MALGAMEAACLGKGTGRAGRGLFVLMVFNELATATVQLDRTAPAR